MNYLSPRNIILAILFSNLISCATIKNYQDINGPIFTGNFSSSSNSPVSSIKVVTYNIKFSKYIHQALNEFKTADNLKDADIILLQEMDESGVQYLANNLSMNYVYIPACLHRHQKNFGNAILSKWPLSQPQKLILPYSNPINGQQRIAVSATIKLIDQKIRVYSVHTEVNVLSLEKRMEQIQYIASNIPDTISNVIIGGDFNSIFSSTVTKIEQIFKREKLNNLSKSLPPTFQPDPLGIINLNLDHLFTKGFTVLDIGVADSTTASDHLPVWAKIKLNESSSNFSYHEL